MITRTWAFTVNPGYHQCPQCHATERACHVYESNGERHVKCFRASCDAYAKYPIPGAVIRTDGPPSQYPNSAYGNIVARGASPEVLKPFLGGIYTPSDKAKARFKEKYGFTIPEMVCMADYSPFPLLFPILSPSGKNRGWVEKAGLFPGEQKINRIWKGKHEPMISWANVSHTHIGVREVWLVEDQISALKLAAKGIRAVALLGTNITLEALSEIQKQAESVVIALDADATAKAFRLARKYGSAFKSCQVKILTKDIKDDSAYN